MSFSKFAQLPPELRLAIWEDAVVSPSMHVFDVCMPDLEGENAEAQDTQQEKRADAAFRQTADSERYSKFKNTVFFDALSRQHDPSMYRWKMALAASCLDALRVASLVPSVGPAASTSTVNAVYLPGPDRRVQYNNDTDVLHLRFGQTQCPKQARALTAAAVSSSAAPDFVENGVLDRQWSDELAVTIRAARHIAVDAGQTSALVNVHNSPILHDEMHMLASTMACALEVLYLVDSCSSGGCADCGHAGARPADRRAAGLLYNMLNSKARPLPEADTLAPVDSTPDRIHGVGKMYTQVFDLEALGWTDQHAAYVFGKALGEAIREQQADAGSVVFQGVRVLVAEDI